MSTIYAMTPAEVHKQLEEPLHLFRTYLDRMTYTMQDLMEGYFQNPDINPDNKDDWWALAYSFKRNATRAEIVDDAIAHLRSVISSLESIDRIIAAMADSISRTEGKQPVEEKPAAATGDCPNIRKLAKHICQTSPNPEAAVELIGAMAKYGASVRASSKKKTAQAVATSGDEKGGTTA